MRETHLRLQAEKARGKGREEGGGKRTEGLAVADFSRLGVLDPDLLCVVEHDVHELVKALHREDGAEQSATREEEKRSAEQPSSRDLDSRLVWDARSRSET